MIFFRPRYELKYLIPPAVAHAIECKLTGRCHLDSHGREGFYVNQSLYFDSPRFDFYFHKVDGVKLRRKVRIRRYGDTGPWGTVFVEIKKRHGQYIEKVRFPLESQLLNSLFDPVSGQHIAEGLTPAQRQVYNEVVSLNRLFHLRPIVFIGYKRKAWWAEGNERLRITFDSDLYYDAVNQNCEASLENTQFILNGDEVIMEIKANGRVPFWVLELLQEFECHITRFSKYCLGVKKAHGLGGNYFDYTKKEARGCLPEAVTSPPHPA